jgi:replication factor A1
MDLSEEELYHALLKAGLSEEEIQERLKVTIECYGGFITEQGALFVISKNLGLDARSSNVDPEMYQEIEKEIDYSEFAINVSNIAKEMTNIVVIGKIESISSIREFARKNGTAGKMGSFVLRDRTGKIKVVLWNDLASILENEYFQEGELVAIVGGYSKSGSDDRLEIHTSSKTKVILSPKDIDPKKFLLESSSGDKEDQSATSEKDLRQKEERLVKLVQGKVKIEDFKEFSRKNGDRSFLLKLMVQDGDSSMFANVWGMSAVKYLKILNDGDLVEICNAQIKHNPYTGQEELYLTNNSSLKVIS